MQHERLPNLAAQVFRATHLETDVAVKKLNRLHDATSEEAFRHECAILKACRNAYIVNFVGVCKDEARGFSDLLSISPCPSLSDMRLVRWPLCRPVLTSEGRGCRVTQCAPCNAREPGERME